MQLQIFNKYENLQPILGDEVQDTVSTENAYNKLHNEKSQHAKFLDSFANLFQHVLIVVQGCSINFECQYQ